MEKSMFQEFKQTPGNSATEFLTAVRDLKLTITEYNEKGAYLNWSNPAITINEVLARLRSLGLSVQQRDDSIFVDLNGQDALTRALREQTESDAHFDLKSGVKTAMQAIRSYETKIGQ